MASVRNQKRTRATFLMPGSLFAEETVRDVDTNDPNEVAKLAPKYAFAFYLEQVVEKTARVLGETFSKTNVESTSGRFYLGGTVYTLAELKEKFKDDPKHATLLINVECNGWNKVIQCRTGNWQPFEEGDTLIEVA